MRTCCARGPSRRRAPSARRSRRPPGPDNGAAAATEPAEPAEPAEAEEPSPEGPVPDWVIQRFEDSIERRGEREERGPGPAEDGAS